MHIPARSKLSVSRLLGIRRNDGRVAPWTGTAHGVLQAVNTYEHHEGTVRGVPRPERNMLRTLSGDFSKLDRSSWQALESVLD